MDDAKKLAQEKADAMGLDDLNQCGWDYAIQTSIGTDDNSVISEVVMLSTTAVP